MDKDIVILLNKHVMQNEEFRKDTIIFLQNKYTDINWDVCFANIGSVLLITGKIANIEMKFGLVKDGEFATLNDVHVLTIREIDEYIKTKIFEQLFKTIFDVRSIFIFLEKLKNKEQEK